MINNILSIFEIILVFILPVYLMQKSRLFYQNRSVVFTLTFFLLVFFILKDGYGLFGLGFRVDNLAKSLIPYTLFTLLCSIVLVFFAKIKKRKVYKEWYKIPHFQFMFLVLSFMQELVYRGYLIPKTFKITDDIWLVILSNSLIFMYIHAIYPNKKMNLTLTFFGGLGFSIIYIFYPNLYLITLSHAILNFIAILFGLIGPEKIGKKFVVGLQK